MKFKAKSIKNDVKRTIGQKHTVIINPCVLNNPASKYIKQQLTELKGETNKLIIVATFYQNPLEADISREQLKNSRDIKATNN